MNADIPESLRELALAQAGVVSRQQIFQAGVTRSALAWRLGQAYWQPLQLGVYALFSGPPSREAVLWSAVLRAGRDAMLSHQTAAELTALVDTPSPLVHITVPADRRVQPVHGLVIHTSSRAGQAKHPSLQPARTRIEETVLDLAGMAATFDDACAWMTKACGRRLTTQDRLRTALMARVKLRWRDPLLTLLSDEARGVHSVLEFRYYRDVERAHGLPQAVRQLRSVDGPRTRYRDASYAEYCVVVELDGRLAHPGDTRWFDIRRDNASAATGSITLRYGWSDVTTNRCRTAGQLAQVLLGRGWTGLPKLCSQECSVASAFR